MAEGFCLEWPFWDDLHAFWSELPNYNPIGVTNAMSGQGFNDQAARLFGNKHGPVSHSHSEVEDDHEESVDVGSRIDEQEGDLSQMKAHSQSQDWDYDELE